MADKSPMSASDMAKKRWAKTTAAQRSAHGRKMGAARWAKRDTKAAKGAA